MREEALVSEGDVGGDRCALAACVRIAFLGVLGCAKKTFKFC